MPRCARTPRRSTPTSWPRWPRPTTGRARRAGGCRPWAVVTYLLGGTLADGTVVLPKYVGSAPADRGRGRHPRHRPGAAAARRARARPRPGSPSTWRRRSAATRRCWCRARRARPRRRSATAGTTPGCSPRARRDGGAGAEPGDAGDARPAQIARVEELTRMPVRRAGRADHDPVGEDAADPRARRRRCRRRKGFNVIATANDRDRGVNELSSALRRRFNTVVLPLPATAEEEVDIVARRVGAARPVAGAAASRRRAGGDPPGGDGLPRAARRASPRTAGPSSSRPSRHAVHGRGDLGGHQRPGAGRPLRRRRAAARPTWPAGIVGAVVQGPGRGPGGLAGVPGDGRPRARRTGRTSTAPAARSSG